MQKALQEMQKKCETIFNMAIERKYNIRLDENTVVTVSLTQLFKPRWMEYFGGEKEVREFIINYTDQDEH